MSINQGERFSNERYLTRNQVSRALGTTLIDDIWKEVLQYRNAFMTTLPLRTVERNRINIVLTPTISDRISQLDRRLTRIQARIQELTVNHVQFEALNALLYRDILKTVASGYDITFNEGIVTQLINDAVSVLSPREMFLNDYYRGLELVSNAQWLSFDERLLGDVGRIFNAPSLSNYIYRTTEIKAPRQLVIGSLYPHVPVNQVTDFLADFYKFMASDSLPTIVQSALTIFYLDYIKPFEAHSEIIAVLVAKSFLAQNELSFIAPFINFELMNDKYKENVEEIFQEVKKSGDLTYFIDLFINVLNESLQAVENHITFVTTSELEAEIHGLDEEVAPVEVKEVINEEPEDLFGYAKLEEKAKPLPIYTPKASATPLPQETPTATKVTVAEAGLGISELPPQLSENEILRLERHLKESDPSLSRAEAYFYARHCTMGKYYTINDFKEVIGCAYETARTSMDHLSNSGYYRKEKFKNKFIYTPTKKA